MTKSAATLRFQFVPPWRAPRHRSVPAFANHASAASQIEVLEGRHDSSPGQSRDSGSRLGCGAKNVLLPFFRICFAGPLARQNKFEKRGGWVCGARTQGGGLGGLALGYYHAAPFGALAIGTRVWWGRTVALDWVPHGHLSLPLIRRGLRASESLHLTRISNPKGVAPDRPRLRPPAVANLSGLFSPRSLFSQGSSQARNPGLWARIPLGFPVCCFPLQKCA